jgi:hypothetical protein
MHSSVTGFNWPRRECGSDHFTDHNAIRFLSLSQFVGEKRKSPRFSSAFARKDAKKRCEMGRIALHVDPDSPPGPQSGGMGAGMSPAGKKPGPKGPRLPRSVRVSLQAQNVMLPSDGLDRVECLACGAAMGIHQPDAQYPEQLLGVCGSCGEWYLLWVKEGEDEGMAIHLSLISLVRRALAAS